MKKNLMLEARSRKSRRHRKIRTRVRGTASRPRLSVHRSLKYVSAQIINDDDNKTVISVRGSDAKEVGKHIAQKAKEIGITTVVFDRGGYLFHGKVKAVADGAREEKLDF